MTEQLSIDGLFAKAWIQLDLDLVECSVSTMDAIIDLRPRLSRNQQELFENIHKKRLAPYRNVLHSEDRELASNESDLPLIGYVKEDAFQKLTECVNYAISRLNEVLIPAAEGDDKSKTFYYRIKADYYRYLSEFTPPESDKTPFEEARKSYQEALNLASDRLEPTDPILLGIVLNYSLFIANFMNDEASAVQLAQDALNKYYSANEDRNEVDEHEANEERELINSIEKNVDMWKAERQSDEDEQQGELVSDDE
ncbi:14-3-3 protein beta/alpha-A [Tritrichomonas foetus]|uniref:14-3-3 protein beta/alpha-A n=1 Tax=Tritrichomonas foetus TaxID=1144522 RepID=A0A1J4KQX7_9EUKA|nr:14-3-3 protein beta/alpha-A [Tritrichomonas foetus]|eukprot:OHT12078.1 14-3-3 protein beta/alpha-A [Tritrichomonas foetus]